MLISYCVPCHKRFEDLALSWPTAKAAAKQSPPVELVLVDYANEALIDGDTWDSQDETPTCTVVYRGRSYYHMAHARNLSICAATGDYVMIGSADFILSPRIFEHIRMVLRKTAAIWLQPARLKGAIVCDRLALVDAGGYDERFEFYGPEDKELAGRLTRRYGAPQTYDADLLSVIPTPDALKIQGYRLPLTKREMHEHGLPVLRESERGSVFEANKGYGWGH